MFCPRCGKKTKNLGLCVNCYLDLNPIYIKNFSIFQCPKCSRFFYKTWNENIDPMQIIRNIKLPDDTQGKITISEQVISKDKLDFSVKIFGKYNDENFEKEISGSAKIIKKICDVCRKTSSGYYEAILQFRGNEKHVKNGFKFIDKKFISKIEEVKNGVDVYLISKDFANSLIKIFSNFGAQIKLSKSIGGVKQGMRVYRKTILIRFPDLDVNDFVLFKNKPYKILKIGKILVCEDLSGQQKQIPIKRVVKIPNEDISKYLK